MHKKFYSFLILILFNFTNARDTFPGSEEPIKKVGGRVLTEKGKINVENEFEFFKFSNGSDSIWELEIGYGITPWIGLEISIPSFIKRTRGERKSSGISDIGIECEWTFYASEGNVGIFFGGIRIPTGTTRKIPLTGRGTLGLTTELVYIHAVYPWYADFSVRGLWDTKYKKKFQVGHLIDYEISFGREIKFPRCSHSFFALLQLFGLYNESIRDRTGVRPRTGASLIFVGPLLAWTNEEVQFEFLFQWPIGQNRFRNPNKVEYRTAISMELIF